MPNYEEQKLHRWQIVPNSLDEDWEWIRKTTLIARHESAKNQFPRFHIGRMFSGSKMNNSTISYVFEKLLSKSGLGGRVSDGTQRYNLKLQTIAQMLGTKATNIVMNISSQKSTTMTSRNFQGGFGHGSFPFFSNCFPFNQLLMKRKVFGRVPDVQHMLRVDTCERGQ